MSTESNLGYLCITYFTIQKRLYAEHNLHQYLFPNVGKFFQVKNFQWTWHSPGFTGEHLLLQTFTNYKLAESDVFPNVRKYRSKHLGVNPALPEYLRSEEECHNCEMSAASLESSINLMFDASETNGNETFNIMWLMLLLKSW